MAFINVNLDNLQEADFRVDFVDSAGNPAAPHGVVTWTSDDESVITVGPSSSPTPESSMVTARTVDAAVGTATVRARDEAGIGADFICSVANRIAEAVDGNPVVVEVRDKVVP
jgi:hypothetical protein